MHNNEFLFNFLKKCRISLDFLESIAFVIFWVLMIYGFDKPYVAGLTLLSVAIHEMGHECCMFAISGERGRIRGVANGFKMQSKKHLSYREEIWLYASGALANLIAALLALPIKAIGGVYTDTFVALNLTTAISNLLPVRNYDGYGVIRSLINRHGAPLWAHRLLSGVSLSVSFLTVVLSLYLMSIYGEGYWIYGVFFFAMLSELDNVFGNQKTGFMEI